MTREQITQLERCEADSRMAGLVVAVACALCSLAGMALTYIALQP